MAFTAGYWVLYKFKPQIICYTGCDMVYKGEKTHFYRILRSKKNRFGSTSKVGVYQMQESGLESVLNPSAILINNRNSHLSGTAIASTFEGQKTFLVEVQALVTPAVYGTPQRSSNGFNLKRLNMLLAVLEKKCGFKLSAKDVFLKPKHTI